MNLIFKKGEAPRLDKIQGNMNDSAITVLVFQT